MSSIPLRTDLPRATINGFALPLGIVPGEVEPPAQGYTLTFNSGEGDEPDTYSFQVVASHERLRPIIHRSFELLPQEVFAIVEIGSRDAYRTMDVYIGERPISRDEFLEAWRIYEPFLVEDSSIGAGANSEEPFVEIFLDAWKTLSIHVPLDMRESTEAMLLEFGLDEVPITWPIEDGDPDPATWQFRPVLDLSAADAPDVEDLLLGLRHDWRLVLNVDPDRNVDDAGHELGMTLWHAVVIAARPIGAGEEGAFFSVWATAGSMATMERFVEEAIERVEYWELVEIEAMDRVAFDDRPPELAKLRPRRHREEIHLVRVESAEGPVDPSGDSSEQNRD